MNIWMYIDIFFWLICIEYKGNDIITDNFDYLKEKIDMGKYQTIEL